jgi:ABC-type methionine transport system ATPase subunit
MECKVRLKYPQRLLDQPLIYGLSQNFQLLTNILEAKVDAEEGELVLLIRGEDQQVRQGLTWMAEQGVGVEVLLENGEEPCA